MSSRTERRGGFVLMEAVVALAIISLFALAVLSTTGAQVRTAAKAGVLLHARVLAQDRLAAIQLLEYDELADLPDSLRAGQFPPPFEDFTWTARVEEMEEEYDLFGVEVVVSGRGETFPLRTLVHSPRPQTITGIGQRGGRAGGQPGPRGGRGGGGGGGARGGRGGAMPMPPPPTEIIR